MSTIDQRPRRSLLAALVALNVLLLGAVAWLVFGPDGEPETNGRPVAMPTADPTDLSEGPAEPDVRDVAPVDVPVALVEVGPADSGPNDVQDASLDAVAMEVDVGSVEPVGKLVGRVTIRVTPPEATVSIRGLGTKPSPRSVRLKVGESRSAVAKLSGYKSKRFSVRGRERSYTMRVTLEPDQMGRVKFRFHPASASVWIDGRRVKTGGTNLVLRKFPVGPHRLTLKGKDGNQQSWGFKIKANQVTNLETITLRSRKPKDGPQ